MENNIKNDLVSLAYTFPQFQVIVNNVLCYIQKLEEENKRLNEYIFIAPNLDKMTAIKYMKIQEEGYIKGRTEEQQKARELIHKYYIPKSLIKEKIEERKLWLSSNDIGYKDDYVLEVLEELLKGKEK